MRKSLLISSLLLATQAYASFDCKIIEVDGAKFDLSALAGTHSVNVIQDTPPSMTTMTWTINPCGALERNGNIPDNKQCPHGTYACGIQQVNVPGMDDPILTEIIPVAGELTVQDGDNADKTKVTELSPTFERLRNGADKNKEGVLVKLNGGQWGSSNSSLSTVIEYLCPRNDEEKEQGLTYIDWDTKILRLSYWTTHACENAFGEKPKDDDKNAPAKDDPSTKDHSWGWFTWFFILFVLGFAIYAIGGAWASYNRYGTTPMNNLPNHEIIRDIPYIVRDFFSKVLGTINGSNRGGYSAV
ncbi:hypothetical protein NADFUDRAFT_52003 [Nadsonia fulvescens var. elongata DSM 6958]|uniref:Autophagy-related protein 27 n=1 Tax=Nadsonia fulvescens var. elongata DSM 6958 TaxID=857566 RepID=A0A1E3PJ08_9ASCO|nr:hypothetical protein NADFUDRAFT_52003 [Nadsonia fulvescens var. elongata DSM 6958]